MQPKPIGILVIALTVTVLSSPRAALAADPAPAVDAARARKMAVHITASMQALAEDLRRRGEPADDLASAVATQAGLTEADSEAIGRVAARLRAQVAPLDQRAKQIIQDARQKYPGGRLEPGTLPPTPPPELSDLQRQRDALVDLAAQDLEQELSPAGLAKLEDHVRETLSHSENRTLTRPKPLGIGPPGAAMPPAGLREEDQR